MASPAASSRSPRPRSASTSPPRRIMASPAASSRSPRPRSASTSPPRRIMASLPGPSRFPHPRSSPDSASNSPPRRIMDSVRVYTVRDSCMEFIAELGRTDRSDDAAQVREQVPAGYEPGQVVLVFLSNANLHGIASLSADGPGYGSDDDGDEEEEQQQQAYTEYDQDPISEGSVDLKQKTVSDAIAFVSGKHTVTEESSSDGSSVGKDKSEEDDDDGWIDWEEDDAEKHEKKFVPAYSLKMRVWPSYGYVNIVLFDGTSWMSTTSYCLSWLSMIDAEMMVEKLADLSQIDMKVDVSQLVSNSMSNLMLWRCEYEGAMVNSAAAEMFVKLQLSPRAHHFNVQNILGKGGFGNVRLCTARDQKDYAIKIIKSEENDLSEPREVAILSGLRSSHVVKFLQGWTESHILVDYEECSESGMSSQYDDSRESGEASTDMQCPRYVLIQMELCQGTLADYLSNESHELDDDESLRIFEEIVQSAQYVHSQNVIHRDIKPGNIFKGKDNKFKLGDFGQSRVQPSYIDSFKATPNLGTIFYGAPELVDGERISVKVDVYPLGIIYFDLFNKFKTALDKSKVFERLKNDDGSDITWNGDISLFRQMIAFDPVKRPSVNDVLEHISQLRSSMHRAEDVVNGLDQPGQSEEVNVTEGRDSTPTEDAETPGDETP